MSTHKIVFVEKLENSFKWLSFLPRTMAYQIRRHMCVYTGATPVTVLEAKKLCFQLLDCRISTELCGSVMVTYSLKYQNTREKYRYTCKRHWPNAIQN